MLLQAKLSVPGSDRPLLQRPRLLTALEATSRLLFVIGPPGSGKTSLVINYVRTLSRPIAWYSMDASDADPAVFLRYLTASLATINPAIQAELDRLVEEISDKGQLASGFAQAVNTMLPQATLVLDDLHSVERNGRLDPLISAVLNALLRYCARLQFVIAARQMLNLDSFVTLLARGEARGLSGQALAFTPEEIDQIFEQTLGAADPVERQRLSESCGGWATAVALTLTTRSSAALPAGDDHTMLYAYLANQVLEQLPPELGAFVIDTSILDYMDAARCDLLRQRNDSAEHLNELIRRNVFVSPTGTNAFRYHPLFREFLIDQLRLQKGRYHALIAAAAEVAKHELRWEWAFDLAMQAGQWSIAANLIAASGAQLRMEGRHTTLLDWLERLPIQHYQPDHYYLKARLLADKGQFDDALLALDFAARGTERDRMQAQLLRARIEQTRGHLDTAAQLIAPYLNDSAAPLEWQPQVLRLDGARLARQGQFELAQQRLLAALELVREGGELVDVAIINQDLGVVELGLGAVDRAEQHFRTADACWQQIGEVIHRSTILNNLGVILLKRGRLAEAESQLMTALEVAQQFGRPRDEVLIRATLGDVAMAAGSPIQADEHYAIGYNIAIQNSYGWLTTYLLAATTHSARLRGDRAALQSTLERLEAAHADSRIECAWIKAAIAGALWTLERAGAAEALHDALGLLGESETEADERVLYSLLYAQILFSQSYLRDALRVFDQVAEYATRLTSLNMLACWAAAAPGLLQLGAERGQMLAVRLLQQAPAGVVAMTAAPALMIRTLGVEHIIRNGEPISGGGPLTREVFFCLLAAGKNGLSGDTLREYIWGEMGDPTGQALKTAIKRVRRDICDVALQSGNYIVRLPPQTEYDVQQFLELVQRPTTTERLLAAVNLYKGPYLPRIEQPWVTELRDRLAEHYVEAQVELGAQQAQSDPQAALEHFRAALGSNPSHVGALVGAMRAETALGRRTQALARYQSYATYMVNELGLDPDQVVEQAYRQILNEM
jgi:DNA-binding SARP family transcriptional activator/Flp pilus assembly protein TadD